MVPDRDADASHREPADEEPPATTTFGPAAVPAPENEPPGIDALDERLPPLSVDSRWWYWVAAVPAYFALSLLVGLIVFAVAVGAMLTDSVVALFVVFLLVFAVLALPGVILTVMFPLGIYADARAIASADLEWKPDPVLYGLLALAAVLMTAFTLSVPLAVYYLYQRHRRVGVP